MRDLESNSWLEYTNESTIPLTSQSVSWLVLRPFSTRLTRLYTMSMSEWPNILFFSLFNESVNHNAYFPSYVSLVTSVCCLKAVMDALVQCWSVHLQLGQLICPITVSKEVFVTLMRSELLEKRALSKWITFLYRIIQWGFGSGRVVYKSTDLQYSFWGGVDENRFKKKQHSFSIMVII